MKLFTNSRDYISYDDRWLMLFGFPATALLVTAMMFSNLFVECEWREVFSCLLFGVVHVAVFWFCFRELYFYTIRKYGNTKKRYMMLAIYIGIAYLVLDFILSMVLDPHYAEIHGKSNMPHEFLKSLSSFVVTTIVLLVYEGSYLSKRLGDVEVEKGKLESQNISSQLEGLKNQVSPHFLFNSLNTLCTLIPESPERAERFVQKLSKVYRYILEIRDKKIITLKEELDYLTAYTFLVKERFGSNIEINVDIDDSFYRHHIVPLSLQILMENAIKHNIISKDQPLHIDIYVDDQNKLVIKNNLQAKRHVSSSTKFGLENIKDRYRFFTHKTVDVIPTAQHFIVILPLIENE